VVQQGRALGRWSLLTHQWPVYQLDITESSTAVNRANVKYVLLLYLRHVDVPGIAKSRCNQNYLGYHLAQETFLGMVAF